MGTGSHPPTALGKALLYASRLWKLARALRPGGFRGVLPDAFAVLLDRRPWTLLRLQTLAFIVGDHATALEASAPRAALGDRQSVFINLASEWELASDEPGAQRPIERARQLVAEGRDPVPVARFFEYLERPADALAAIDGVGAPVDSGLLADLGSLHARHGDPELGLKLVGEGLSRNGHERRLVELREEFEGDVEVLGWDLGSPGATTRGASKRGPVLHMVSRSLPAHTAGATFRTHYTVAAQRSAGLDAQIITSPGFGTGPVEDHQGVPHHRLVSIGEARRLDERIDAHVESAAAVVEQLEPTVIHPASDYLNALVALRLRQRYELPVVYEVRGFPEEYLPRRPGSRMLYEKWGTRRMHEARCWRAADHIVTLAEVMARHIISKGVDPDRVTVVPNAVDIDRFTAVARDPQLASTLGIQPDEAVVGYVTSFHPYEGLRYLIEAIARLRGRGKKVKALLVGEGSERDYLEHLAERLGVSDDVIFTGRIDHGLLPSYYGLIDVFVVPRTTEATTELVTPLKPFEAMAMEKAVVVSSTDALLEVIDHGEVGESFRPEDAGDLADTLESLIEQPDRRRELGEAAREWVGRERTWERNVERYRTIYGKLGALDD